MEINFEEIDQEKERNPAYKYFNIVENKQPEQEYPEHLSFVEVDVWKDLFRVGRVKHNYPIEGQISVVGISQDEKNKWFEWCVQLNHPSIRHTWKIVN